MKEKKEKKEKKKKPKIVYIEDDGHTIYSMENVGRGSPKKDGERVPLERKERHAAIRAALGYYFPRLLLVLGCFIVVGLLLYFWLN